MSTAPTYRVLIQRLCPDMQAEGSSTIHELTPPPRTIFEAYAAVREWQAKHPAVTMRPGQWGDDRHIIHHATAPAPDGTTAALVVRIIPPSYTSPIDVTT